METDSDRYGGDGTDPPADGAEGRPRRDTTSFDDDHYLVERLIAGDEDAWTEANLRIYQIVERSGAWRRMLRDWCLSRDDVASEVFLSLAANDWRNLRNFRFECAFSTWLHDQVRAAMTTLRRNFTRERPVDLSEKPGDDAPILWPTPHVPPTHIVAAREDLESFNVRLAELWDSNPVHAVVLILCKVEGLSAKEAAAITGLSPANIDQINKRALDKLGKINANGDD